MSEEPQPNIGDQIVQFINQLAEGAGRAITEWAQRNRERDDVSDPRSVHVGPAMILDTATGKHVQPLAADLTPFLDWPLYFPDDSVHCDAFPRCPNRDCCDPESGQVYIASARRMTVREFLADVRTHAEGK